MKALQALQLGRVFPKALAGEYVHKTRFGSCTCSLTEKSLCEFYTENVLVF